MKILDLLQNIKDDHQPNGLLDVERGVLSNVDDDVSTQREAFDDDDLYQDQKFMNQNHGLGVLKEKRAWEEINWKPPKRAWEITKRAWEQLDGLKAVAKWKDNGKRSEEKLIDIPLQTSESGPWMIDDIGYDAVEYKDGDRSDDSSEKRSWEGDRRFIRCGCCSEKATSACCSICRALTTFKRSYNEDDNEILRRLACRCCKSVWYQTDACCFMCDLLSGSRNEIYE